jgi:hypothetical protein
LGSYCPFPVFALATAHVAFQFVDRRRLSPAYNIERDGLVGVAAEAFDFEVKVAGVQGVAKRPDLTVSRSP